MSRRLFLPSDQSEIIGRLPVMLTHREWCHHLRDRGQLSENHRGCLRSDTCVATAFKETGQEWRYRSN